MSARSTVRPPSPESKTPIGASVASITIKLMGPRGATEPIGHRDTQAARRRCDREYQVEAELVGLPKRAVQIVGVADDVDGSGERHEHIGQVDPGQVRRERDDTNPEV